MVSARHGSFAFSQTQLTAKKKRRRRKDGKAKEPSTGENPADIAILPALDDGDLPDFDLGDDEPVESAGSAPALKKAAPSSIKDDSVLSVEDPRVQEAMRGSKSTGAGTKSMDQLLRDRTLEESFKFDPVGEDALPTLGEISSSPRSGLGDKASDSTTDEAEARRAAAMEAEESETDEGGILSKVPQFLGEDGKVSPVKILENGAWAGIFALVAWEVYLNSPFFERAAPMAPVVYQLWL